MRHGILQCVRQLLILQHLCLPISAVNFEHSRRRIPTALQQHMIKFVQNVLFAIDILRILTEDHRRHRRCGMAFLALRLPAPAFLFRHILSQGAAFHRFFCRAILLPCHCYTVICFRRFDNILATFHRSFVCKRFFRHNLKFLFRHWFHAGIEIIRILKQAIQVARNF